jgi:two-component system LytT family sensor kinase
MSDALARRPAPSAAADSTSQRNARLQSVLPWPLFFWMWLAFWTILFLLGVREYRWEGGERLFPLGARYATAALVSTVIGVLQLHRGSFADQLLGQPARWFALLWKWAPLEVSGFVIVMFAAPRVFEVLSGASYRSDHWFEIELYDTGKFLLFYFIAGWIQFGIHSYNAWQAERLGAAEQARLTREAQLLQLTQQLQPHFLFNAMNTVSSLIHSDPDLADELLAQLAVLLRAATGASRRSEQPLSEELALLRAYADIMTKRFAERVRVEWAVSDDTLACLVPTLGLQPLLENCFVHVVEQRRAPTRVTVRARKDERNLCIEIEDDGEPHGEPPVLGVGLGNLRRRLKSLHGEKAGVAFVPRAGRGLIVRLNLPCAY